MLEGAPALVSAVNRYVEAWNSEPASFNAPEVEYALASAPYQGLQAPNYDARPLRDEDRKLGLGSSAAILLASLACLPPTDLSTPEGVERLFQHALKAHRDAQGGGSGIDVACSCFGGTLSYQLDAVSGGPPRLRKLSLPSGLHFEIWASDHAASTRHFVSEVRAAKLREPVAYADILTQLWSGAEQAQRGSLENDAALFLDGMRGQSAGFKLLGELARLPIETEAVNQLARLAKGEDAHVLPAGAGGGDIALWCGPNPPSESLLRKLPLYSHRRLELRLGALGVHLC